MFLIFFPITVRNLVVLSKYLEVVVFMMDHERQAIVDVLSSFLKNARGDAGRMLLDAYYKAEKEPNLSILQMKMKFLDEVRSRYVKGDAP